MRVLALLKGVPVSVVTGPACSEVNGRQVTLIVLRIFDELILNAAIDVSHTACIGLVPCANHVLGVEVGQAVRVRALELLKTKE